MSVLNKKPFIVSLLASLTAEEATTLRGLVNGSGSVSYRCLKPSIGHQVLSASDKGISKVVLNIDGYNTQNTYEGYLIYTDTRCVLISYVNDNVQLLTMIELSQDLNGNWSYEIIDEVLSILELRSELDDVLDIDSGSGAEILEVSNITALNDNQINGLKAGDLVIKKTGNQKHTYTVSYMEKKHGICLTYVDAYTSETVSYDYVGGHWVYNSTDVVAIPEFPSDAATKTYVLKLVNGTLTWVEEVAAND